MPRVTRAQAEAALEMIVEHSDDVPVVECIDCLDGIATLRAYLAQQPDEDTIRKGHEALSGLLPHDAACYTNPPCRGDCLEGSMTADIRAAMYQPEEEA